MLAGVNTLCKSLNIDFKGLGFSYFSTSEGCGKSKLNLLVCKSDNELSVFINSIAFIINGPSDRYILIVLTNEGKLNSCILDNIFNNSKVFNLCLNLFSVGLGNYCVVREAISAGRNKVRIATVKNEDTGSGCRVTKVCCVRCIDASLVRCLKSGGEVGYISSYVCLLTVKLKVKVLAGSAKHLISNGNALNGYYETYVVLKALTCCELIGNIKNRNILDSLVNDYEIATLGFLHTAVRRCGSRNSNGHTELNTCLKGILVELVAVVTALAVYISEEEVVSGVAYALCVDTNNDTCNGNHLILCSSHVFLKGGYNELRNSTIVRNGCGSSVRSSDNTGNLIVYGLLGHFVNHDSPVGATFNSSNLVAVNGPSNSVLVKAYHYLTEQLIVSSGNGIFILVHSVKELCSCLNVILRSRRCRVRLFRGALRLLGSGSFGCSGCFCASGILGAACSKDRKAHKHCQTNCN